MNLLKEIRSFASKLNHFESITRQIVKEEFYLNDLKQSVIDNKDVAGVNNVSYFNYPLIVSLTTYGRRIHTVHLTIESIMKQTYKPNRIVLWLSEDEFKLKDLPYYLTTQIERGLEIRFCEDLKSYKKLIPALIDTPNAAIITIDDDVLYSDSMLENMIKDHIKYPDVVLFNRGHKMNFNKKGQLNKYLRWDWEITTHESSLLNFPTGVGGVLYPPHALNKEFSNIELLKKLCPTNDDIWFKAMTLINIIECKKCTGINFFYEMSESSEPGLNLINNNNGQNDKQIFAAFSFFKIYDIIKNLD